MIVEKLKELGIDLRRMEIQSLQIEIINFTKQNDVEVREKYQFKVE